jgi:hypothetical protein
MARAGGILLLILSLAFSGGAEAAALLKFSEMYAGASSLGLELSEKLQALDGKEVLMEGFMAPPLKPTLDFFVLTRIPMSVCPFCSSDADWPYDIVVVYLRKKTTALPCDRPLRVEGRLEVGTKSDPETGFVSLVRIYAQDVREFGP